MGEWGEGVRLDLHFSGEVKTTHWGCPLGSEKPGGDYSSLSNRCLVF